MNVKMISMKTVWARVLIGASLAAVVACNDTPVDPTPTPTRSDLFFASQLMAGGAVSRTFTTTQGGEVKVFFTSLIPDTAAVVAVGLGTSDGTTCTPTQTVMVAQGSTESVLTTTLGAGTHCVRISDPGVLTKTNDFSITVNYPFGS
jgi:hypothetical protein